MPITEFTRAGLPFSRPVGRGAVPTTMVWSDGDTAIDRAGVEATAKWCTGPYELVVLAGVDRWVPTHAPVAAAGAILDWIRA